MPRGRGGSRGGFRKPPREASGVVVEAGEVMHSVPNAILFRSLARDVPMFNQPVFKDPQGRQMIGKVDEILGPVGGFMFTVLPVEGLRPTALAPGAKGYIDKAFFLPLSVFLNPPKAAPRVNRGVVRGGGFGGRGGSFGGRGGRGGGRGSFRGGGGFRGGRGGRH